MTRRRRAWTLVTALGVLVAIGVPVGWSLTRPAETVGAQVAAELAGTTPAGPTATPTGADPSPAAPTPAVPTQDGRVGAAGTTAAPAPTEVELPSIGVRTAVDPVGVDREGELEIPEDVDDIGWYRFGPRPGEATGSAVFSGHVDSAEQGQGAFYRLRELGPGDPVIVRTGDGEVRRYRVVSREEWPKSEVPLGRIFSRGGAARLTLVTCGGGFREDIRSYQDNIAVTAVPEGSR